jgi:hypothetical protein
MSEHKIGDEVFWARLESSEFRLECPDCCGKRFLTVTMGDGSQVTIGCSLCERGYEPSRGYVTVNQYTPSVELARIERVEVKLDGEKQVIEYGLAGRWCVSDEDIFLMRDDAQVRAEAQAKELGGREIAALYKRERGTRSWAWNVRYHRECLKRAHQEIAYHTAKLDAAKISTKREAGR